MHYLKSMEEDVAFTFAKNHLKEIYAPKEIAVSAAVALILTMRMDYFDQVLGDESIDLEKLMADIKKVTTKKVKPQSLKVYVNKFKADLKNEFNLSAEAIATRLSEERPWYIKMYEAIKAYLFN